MADFPDLIDAKETAQLVRHHYKWLPQLVENGDIPPPIRIGRKRLWERDRLLEHIGISQGNPSKGAK